MCVKECVGNMCVKVTYNYLVDSNVNKKLNKLCKSTDESCVVY